MEITFPNSSRYFFQLCISMLMSMNKQSYISFFWDLFMAYCKRHNVWFPKVSITFTVVLPGNQEGKIENELLSGRTDGETDPFIVTQLALFPVWFLAVYVQKWLRCQATAGKLIRKWVWSVFFFFLLKRRMQCERKEDVRAVLPLGEDRHNPCPLLNALKPLMQT